MNSTNVWRMRACVSACVYVCVCVRACMCVCESVWMCVCVWVILMIKYLVSFMKYDYV